MPFMTTIMNHLISHHNHLWSYHNHLKLNHRLLKVSKHQWLHSNTIWKWIRDMLASCKVNTIWRRKLLLSSSRFGRWNRGARCTSRSMKNLMNLLRKVLTVGVTVVFLLTHTSILSQVNLNHHNLQSHQRLLQNPLNPNLMLHQLKNHRLLLPSLRVNQLLSRKLRLKNQLHQLQPNHQKLQNLLKITIPTITERKISLS